MILAGGAFDELLQLFVGHQLPQGRPWVRVFQTNAEVVVEVGGREGDPAIGRTLDEDLAKDRLRRPRADDFAKPDEGGFQLSDREVDGIHGEKARSRPLMTRTGF